MTLSTTTRTIQHLGTGSLATFSYNFRVDEESHLEVFVTDVTGADFEQSDYTVSGTGDPNGGNITFGEDAIPSLNERITISREVPYTQTTDLVEGGLMRAETVESTFDYTVMQTQQLNDETGRTLRAPVSDLSPSMILPPAGTRAEKFMYFDDDGNVTVAEGQLVESSHNHDSRYLLIIGSDATEQTISGSITTTRDMSARNMNASGNIKQGGTQVSLDGHIHDTRYYTESEVDAKDAILDAKIDTTSGTLQDELDNLTADHGLLNGLSDDDHTQYLLRTDFTTYSGSMVVDWTAADAVVTAAYLAADVVLDTKIDTTSGTLQTQITTYSDHGNLLGLSDDDHAQYLNTSRGDARYYTETELDAGQLDNRYYTESEVDTISGALSSEIDSDITTHASSADHDGRYYTESEVDGLFTTHHAAGSTDHDDRYYTETEVDDKDIVLDTKIDTTSGTLQTQITTYSDHGNLSGLGDDDHTQYHNNTRGDARYYTETELDAGQLDNRYYTETEMDNTFSSHSSSGDHDGRYYTESEVDTISGSLSAEIDSDITVHTGLPNAHHNESHTIESHSDTTASGGELNELTDGSTTSLHNHTIPAIDKIEEGNSSVEVIDAGTGSIVHTLDGIAYLTSVAGGLSLYGSVGQGYDYLARLSLNQTVDDASGSIGMQNNAGTGKGYLWIDSSDRGVLQQGNNTNQLTLQTGGNVTIGSSGYDYAKLNVTGGIHLENETNTTDGNIRWTGTDFEGRKGGAWISLTGLATGVSFGSIITDDNTYVGDTLTVTVDDGSSAFGSVLYQAADFHYERADANDSATAPGYAIALEGGTGSKLVLIRGQICDTAWNWTAGKVYLSGTTGDMTQTVVSGVGDQVQVLGWALSADTIFFDPVTMVVEVTA